jgi:hypothetical protein
VLYWRAKLDKVEADVKANGLGILADADFADYRRMETFASKTPDMLRLVQDILKPANLRISWNTVSTIRRRTDVETSGHLLGMEGRFGS